MKVDLGKKWLSVAVIGYLVVVAGAIIYPLQYTSLTSVKLLSFMITRGTTAVFVWTGLCYFVSLILTKRALQNRLSKLSEKGPRYIHQRSTSM